MADRGAGTVAFYDRNAASFAARTADLDMSPFYGRFLRHVRPGGRVLDAGCGVGRDARAFAERGFGVIGFDASPAMVRLAGERVGGLAEIRHMRFEDVTWREEFDGVWACASLLHVPSAEFAGVAARLAGALRPGGAWYMSFKLGRGERVAEGRRFTDHTEETLRRALAGGAVTLSEAWVSEDLRPGRAAARWVNAMALRPPKATERGGGG